MTRNMMTFYPDGGASGAEFKREAESEGEYFGIAPIAFPVNVNEAARRRFVLDEIKKHGKGVERIDLLCHGWQTGIQAGFDRSNCSELARAIAGACLPGASVGLYACSTGKGPGVDRDGTGEAYGVGEGGFADSLRDWLGINGMEGGYVFAHSSKGHLSMNPDVRMYRIGTKEAGGVDIAPLFVPLGEKDKRSPAKRKADRSLYLKWRSMLHDGNRRWEIPEMTPEILRVEIERYPEFKS